MVFDRVVGTKDTSVFPRKWTYRPGMSLAISAHLFPWILWASMNTYSSSSVQGAFRTIGSRWLCHLNIPRINVVALPLSALLSISARGEDLAVENICNQSPSFGPMDPHELCYEVVFL